MRKGLNFLLKLVKPQLSVDPDRLQWPVGYFYFPHDNNSKMHGQGYATLALATALGTSTGERHRDLRAVVDKAVACIEQSQTETGGFGYEPVANADHEGSVTVTVAQGLRAARDAGVLVNENVVRKGLHYLKRSQNVSDGSFRYSVYLERSSYALTAAALSSFLLYGRYQDDTDRTIERGMEYMMGRVEHVLRTGEWYYYGNFYAAWTCWQMDGDEWDPASGGYWARWHRRVYPHLIAGQREGDGSWEEDYDRRFDFGPLLPTAFAVLTLAIPDEVLPIFQR
ncbi:MAG: prenyltransferase/squalene oxidase repeat-containing protein [Planctomycetota bacterium]